MVRGMPSNPFRLLGLFIALERNRAGLTQREVAARLGKSQGWLSRIECGPRQCIDVVELVALADVIGFNPADASPAETPVPLASKNDLKTARCC